MNNILLLHGPNLNLLGKRDPVHYGNITLQEIEDLIRTEANQYHYKINSYQSNHEGNLIDFIQAHAKSSRGMIVNPGAFAHYSYALHDAILDTALPTIEVHLSLLQTRESWRQRSVIAPACMKVITGKKSAGYIEALHILLEHLAHD